MPDLIPSAAAAASEHPRRGDAPQLVAALTGTVFVLIQFDVCEEIQLARLSEIIRARTISQPRMKHPAPGHLVRLALRQ
jgi:hypothetical protein